jgi:membrane fusion protein, multidrug efflux system
MTKKNVFLTIFLLVLVVGAIASVKFLQISTLIAAGENQVEPPTTISSIAVKAYEWESTLTAIGSLEAAKGLEITADLSGRITKILFDAGSEVSAGDLLLEQDTSTEKAQLRAAASVVALEKNNFDRVAQLYARKVASTAEYDSAENAYQSALAEADNIKASIEKKSIRAPFNGRLGIRQVNLGQSISAGEPVVSLQSTDQMFVNFFLPQQNLAKLAVGLTIRLTSDAVPGKVFAGKINAINPEIDSETRSLGIQAILSNPDGELLTGMFASIDVVLASTSHVLLIPITAVKYATYGDSVFVIGPKNTEATSNISNTNEGNKAQVDLVARQQFVRLGETRGDYVVVTKGLTEGETIASAGVFKLRNGGSVAVNNTVVPEFSLTPELKDQ